MSPEPAARPPSTPPARGWGQRAPWLLTFAILLATVPVLRLEGRIWWCKCGLFRPWITDVWTSHCSQHLSDPYTITHLSHGLIFYMALQLLCPRVPLAWRACIAVAIAAGWEIFENTPFVINRYRTATMSLDYLGDSVVNATGDVLACFLGFFLARWLGMRWSLAVFIVIEIVLLVLMRDNLTLNVIMLIYPVQTIKAWQSVGHSAAFIALAAARPSLRAASPASQP